MSERDRVIARANWLMATQIYTDLITLVSGSTALERDRVRRPQSVAIMLERAVNACMKSHNDNLNPEISRYCEHGEQDCDYRAEVLRLYEAHLSAM